MPICNCTLHLYRYRVCRHYANPVKHECWRADWRDKGMCGYSFFSCGTPTKVRHNRNGMCEDCKVYFAQFGHLSKQVLESFLEYKESRGWRKKRVNPKLISPEKFIHPNILGALQNVPQPQPFRPHSPMKAESGGHHHHHNNNNGDFIQPPPPVHHTKSSKRQAKRRPQTPHEPFVKPISESSFDQTAEAADPEYVEVPLTPQQFIGSDIPLYEIPRPHSTEESPLVRRITEVAERLFPNPESPVYPGVPKLSMPPKHRRLRRGTGESAAEGPTVIPAVIIDLPEPLVQNIVSPIAAPTPTASPEGTTAGATLRRARGRSRLFTPAAGDSALVRALSLETLSEQQIQEPPRCAQHVPGTYDFACSGCRSSLFRDPHCLIVTTADEHGNRQRVRSKSVAIPSGETVGAFPVVEGGWI